MKTHYTTLPVHKSLLKQRSHSSLLEVDRRRVLVRLLAEAYCARLQRYDEIKPSLEPAVAALLS